MDQTALIEVFVAGAGPEVQPRARAASGLGEVLARLVEEGRDAVEGLAFEPEAFIGFVAARVPDDAELPAALEGLAVPDLVLAHGCHRGDPLALELFVMRHQADIERAAEKCRTLGLTAAEFTSIVHERLFVAPGKISGYRGRGDLKGWLRVVLSHLVVDLRRRAAARPEQRPTEPDDLTRLVDGEDLELGYVKEHYREPFRAALEHAFSELTPRERNLLRLRLLEGWGYDQVGARYGVHRTSVARWLAAAQQTLLDTTWARLHADHAIARDEFLSLARLVQSRMHLSARRILQSKLEPE